MKPSAVNYSELDMSQNAFNHTRRANLTQRGLEAVNNNGFYGHHRVIRTCLCGAILALLALLCRPASAHEFWIEPASFHIEAGQVLLAQTLVGQLFAGDSRPYVDSYYRRLVQRNGKDPQTRVTEIRGRLGDLPAIQIPSPPDGLLVLGLHSSDSEILRTSFDGFQDFLVEEGLEWGVERHRERNLPLQGFSERFVRFAKALVKTGGGEGSDAPLGFRFEWVALNNPYVNSSEEVRMQLRLDSEPVAYKQVSVFIKSGLPDDPVRRLIRQTDESGVLALERGLQGAVMINAVHLEEIDRPAAGSAVWIGTEASQPVPAAAERAVWRSLWASMVLDMGS